MSGEYKSMAVLPHLPELFHGEWAEPIPQGLLGARIIRFGAAPIDAKIEGGGLVIDYVAVNETHVRRVIFKFTVLGMWVAYAGTGPVPS